MVHVEGSHADVARRRRQQLARGEARADFRESRCAFHWLNAERLGVPEALSMSGREARQKKKKHSRAFSWGVFTDLQATSRMGC